MDKKRVPLTCLFYTKKIPEKQAKIWGTVELYKIILNTNRKREKMEKIIGINPVIEVLKSDKNVEKLEIYKKIRKETIREILNLASKKNIKIFYTDRRTENSQGVVALVSEFDYYVDFDAFLEKLLRKEKSIVVILDQVQDPRNFGAIIRSAECFGVDGIIIQDRNSVKVTETVVKSSTGAIEYVDIVKVTNISDTIDKLKKYGYTVYGAEADGQNYYYEENYPEKTCLVLGSEGNGMRKKVKEHCDKIVKIHLKGEINSLNVSVAGGIILAEMSK